MLTPRAMFSEEKVDATALMAAESLLDRGHECDG